MHLEASAHWKVLFEKTQLCSEGMYHALGKLGDELVENIS